MTGYNAPPEGDGRTRKDRSLPQRLGAARAALAVELTEFKRLGQAIVRADRNGNRTKVAVLAELIREGRTSIALRKAAVAELETEAEEFENGEGER